MQARFKEHFQMCLQAVSQINQIAGNGMIPDLKSYNDLRRDVGAIKMGSDLVEYVNGIDLPQLVVEHPIIEALVEGAIDSISLSNVCLYIPAPFLR